MKQFNSNFSILGRPERSGRRTHGEFNQLWWLAIGGLLLLWPDCLHAARFGCQEQTKSERREQNEGIEQSEQIAPPVRSTESVESDGGLESSDGGLESSGGSPESSGDRPQSWDVPESSQSLTDTKRAAVEQATAEPRQYDYKKFPNVAYVREADYTLLCDIYQPLGEGPFPAVVAIHGGAWTHGSKLSMIRHAWKLARAGYVVVSINYRLAPEYKFPAQVHDCKRAVRWIRAKQEKLKIDPEQIAVFGYSAGGHLGAMLGATDDSDDLDGELSKEEKKFSARVQCVVVGGGPCEFSWIKSRALVHWIGDNPQNAPELYTRASPLHYVSNDDPPFIFFHGGGDGVVPVESAKKMHERLSEVGVASKFHTVGDKSHIATFSDTTWLDEAIAFMDEQLNRKHYE